MQSQVVSGVPPFLLLYFCSLQQKDCPLIFPSLLPLVFLLLCLSESLSLSFLWPFISPPTPPLALSRGISLDFSERVSC